MNQKPAAQRAAIPATVKTWPKSGHSGPRRPVCRLSEAWSRRGGLVPGMTSFLRCSLISCFSSAPLISVIRLRLANCSLVRPNHDVVTNTPVVALWSAMTPVRAWTDSSPTRPVHRLACIRHTPPKNKFLLVATASTPPSFEGMVVQASAPIAINSWRTRCSNSVGESLSRLGRESRSEITSISSVKRNRLRSNAMNGSTASMSYGLGDTSALSRTRQAAGSTAARDQVRRTPIVQPTQ